ncbi:MAG: T9SS C-terminal target domain-containing protein [Ignavibacteriales bacterium]|nr:MAG: T9SS C-terminal target domain-containing protein [Ignavibacteriales bacterium]
MFRIAKILCVFFFFSLSFAQEKETNFNLVYPAFIPLNSSFDISLTITNSYPEADEFELLIIPENRLLINEAVYNSVYETLNLHPQVTNSEEFFGNIYSVKFRLDDSLRYEGIVFQLLLNMKIEQNNSSVIKLKGMFKQEGNVIAYLSSQNPDELNNELTAEIEFYNPQRIPDKALTLAEHGLFNIDIQKDFENNLLVDFWIKLYEPSVQFLKIYDKDFQEPAVSLSTNKFQMLSVSAEQFNQVFLKPYFIGKQSWYHITIATSKEKGTINFYCNGSLIAKNILPSLFEENNLRFVFSNELKDKSFLIDLLRIVDLNNSNSLSFNNRHSVHFNSESSTPAAIYKMDSQNEFLTENKNVSLEFSNIRLVKSDAPLFARSPELNITLLGNSYELQWKGGDYKQAQNYILEKSAGSSYHQIYSVQADNTREKSYTFIDMPDENSEVVYYRIRQQNYDGSVVYSSQVKIGQGITEPFTIGQNYPNPFNPKTSIEIELIQDSEIEIIIYSLDGREITKLFKGFLPKGQHKFDFDGEGLPSGIYLYKIAAPNFTQTKKMILTK